MNYSLTIGEKKFDVQVGDIIGGVAKVVVNGVSYDVKFETPAASLAKSEPAVVPKRPSVAPISAPPEPKPASVPKPVAVSKPIETAPSPAPTGVQPAPAAGAGIVKAPIPGLILDIKVNVGDSVNAGQTVATMEAMKMENRLVSPIAGTVKEIRVQKGAQVSTGDVIIVIGQ